MENEILKKYMDSKGVEKRIVLQLVEQEVYCDGDTISFRCATF